MLYLTCIMISSVDLAHYGVSRAKDWVSVDCGTMNQHRDFNCLVSSKLRAIMSNNYLYFFL